MRFITWILAVLLIVLDGVSAQGNTPLIGPIVAATPAAQDRIILYDIGGEARRELSFGAGWHHVWGFSPDGCRILFTLTNRSGLARAYTANLNGRDMQPLIQYDDLPAGQWGVWEPQWSPDGERIAFTMLRDGFEGEVERQFHVGWVEPDGGEPNFYSVSGREHTPQWSPDSQWLAYISYDERVAGADMQSTAVPTPENQQPSAPPTMLNEADLWVVSADGATKYQLTNFPVGSATMPRWSPDSELLSFVYSPSSNNDTFWIIANRSGAIPTQLSFQWSLAMDISWMPDSSALVTAVRDYRATEENRLWRIPLAGGNTETNSAVYLDALEHADYPRFSPDGNWLILRSTYILMLVNLQDNSIIALDENLPGNTPGVWSPGGFEGENNCE